MLLPPEHDLCGILAFVEQKEFESVGPLVSSFDEFPSPDPSQLVGPLVASLVNRGTSCISKH
jgi:hypothetical protein